jgi:hypothetical protein
MSLITSLPILNLHTQGRVIAKVVILAERIWKPSKTCTLSRDPLLPTGQSTFMTLFRSESIQTGIIGCVKPRIPLLRPLPIRVTCNLCGKNSINSVPDINQSSPRSSLLYLSNRRFSHTFFISPKNKLHDRKQSVHSRNNRFFHSSLTQQAS